MNVLDDAAGLAEMRRLGARGLPVVARGGRFVFAQVLRDVTEFLGLEDDTGPKLSPAALFERYDRALEVAIRLVAQMPDACLDNELPNRPRSWRVLMHHVFQVPSAFLDAERGGEPLTYELLTAPPPNAMRSSADIAGFGEALRARLRDWWAEVRGDDFSRTMKAYFGEPTRHEMFERTVWHSMQHVRQVASLLEQAGVQPDRPLAAEDLEGLPLTERVWD